MNIPPNSFEFRNPKREEIYKVLIKINPNFLIKEVLNEIPESFLKDGAALMIELLCYVLSLAMCQTAKLKCLYKKCKVLSLKTVDLFITADIIQDYRKIHIQLAHRTSRKT